MTRSANHSTRELIHKSNEVIGRDLEFGIGTIAREHDGDTRRKREPMTTKEDVEIEEGKQRKKERKEDGTTEEGGEGARWYVGAAVLESVPDREEKKESGSV